MNFYLEVYALDHVQTYWLWVERDTITPVIELYEITKPNQQPRLSAYN